MLNMHMSATYPQVATYKIMPEAFLAIPIPEEVCYLHEHTWMSEELVFLWHCLAHWLQCSSTVKYHLVQYIQKCQWI